MFPKPDHDYHKSCSAQLHVCVLAQVFVFVCYAKIPPSEK